MLQNRNKFQKAAGTTIDVPDRQFSSGNAYAMLKRRSSVGSWCMAIAIAQSEDRTGSFGGCSKATRKSSRNLSNVLKCIKQHCTRAPGSSAPSP